jgi:hypothetical protein
MPKYPCRFQPSTRLLLLISGDTVELSVFRPSDGLVRLHVNDCCHSFTAHFSVSCYIHSKFTRIPMRSYLGRLLRFTSRSKPSNTSTKRSFHQKSTGPFARMSSASAAAALYAATISTASITGAVPENAKDKAHHLKDGKGFTNPWDSWIEIGGWAIARALLWYEESWA